MQAINANPEANPAGPLDVWLRFENEIDEECSHEANTFLTDTGYEIRHYHTAVGLVSRVQFDTLADAYDWYEANGFEDYTVAE